jgi:hypothetical protein
MSVEMAAVVFDGTRTAERELSNLRTSRSDAWLNEVAVLERHEGGRFSMKATSPDYGDKDHVGAGIALGGGTGLLLGLIAGPLGLLFWGAMGAARAERSAPRRHQAPSIHLSTRSRTRCRAATRR